jgi:hypothetical protein
MLAWQLYRNLENSLKEFLDNRIIEDSVTDIKGNLIPIRIGRREENDWSIPCITFYFESETAPRLEIGSNKRDDNQLIIIDIYASDEGERLDLTKWLVDTINDGFRYYSYASDSINREHPAKVEGGWVNVDFLTNIRINLGQNIDPIDAHRQRISILAWISGS